METTERSLATSLKNEPQPNIPLCIRLFGGFELLQNSLPLPRTRSRTEQWLLALLLLRGHQGGERSWLAGTFWPDSHEEQARNNLRRSLSNLRQVLGEEAYRLLSPTPRTLVFDLSGLSCDLIEFDAAIQRGDTSSLEQAVALYRGPLLPDCNEAWLLPERQTREQACLSALETLAASALQADNLAGAIVYLRQVLSLDPYRETAVRNLMQALNAYGNRAEAILAYRGFRLLLNDQLQVEPAPETIDLYQRLRKGGFKTSPRDPEQPSDGQPSPPKIVTRLHIPRPISNLVGREAERAEVAALLSTSRLVTLTGSGGIGKTRLALATAEDLAEAFPDGIWFVDLSSLSDSTSVVQAVATKLGVREEAGRNLVETLITFLAERRSLLLMDNCEHLLNACAALITSLLQSLPDLCVLATSRQALGITGERAWRVPSLSLPERAWLKAQSSEIGAALPLSASLLEFDAVRLFVERAIEASAAWTLTEKNASAVVQICQRLDGIPLALEMAAARVKALSEEHIAERLGDCFRLLTRGSRTAPTRQQTLRVTLDWSYNLLTEAERLLLDRLSVFAGGWTVEAAEAIVTGPSFPLPASDLQDLLTELIDKSLVVMEAGAEGGARYRLLETIRQYGHEKLRGSEAWRSTHERHRDFFLALAEEAETQLSSPDQAHRLDVLETEHDNLRQALSFCLQEPAGAEAGLRLGSALAGFWEIRGYLGEGREHLRAVLSHTTVPVQRKARADALRGAGNLALYQSDYASARQHYEAGLAIRRELGDKLGIASSLNNLGSVALHQGDYASARALFEESLAIRRELGNKLGIASCLLNLGNVADIQGDFAAARPLHQEALEISRELGNRLGIAASLNNLGLVVSSQGDFAAAHLLHQEALEISRELGDRRVVASCLHNLGNVAYIQGDFAAAHLLHQEALAIRRELGDRRGIATSLNNLGAVAKDQGDYALARAQFEESLEIERELGDRPGIVGSLGLFASLALKEQSQERAVRLWSAASALREEIGSPLRPEERKKQEREEAAAKEALGEDAFAAAWKEGRAMTLEQAIELLLGKPEG